MGHKLHVRCVTNRDPVAGPDLFRPNYRDGDSKRYVTASIKVEQRSSVPDSGWVPLRDTIHTDPPINAGAVKAEIDAKTTSWRTRAIGAAVVGGERGCAGASRPQLWTGSFARLRFEIRRLNGSAGASGLCLSRGGPVLFLVAA